MASKPGGYSGGDKGPMGSHTGAGSASGTGFSDPKGGFSRGMQGATSRRTSVQSPGYQGSLHNYGQLGKEVLGFMGGPVTTAAKAISGYGPSYQGYTGHVNTPGSYDPKGGPQQAMFTGAPVTFGRSPLNTPQMLTGLRAPFAAPQPQGLLFKPQMYQPQQINIPGGSGYSQGFDPWKYFA